MQIKPFRRPRCHNNAEQSELSRLLSLRLRQSSFFPFFLSGTKIKRLTPFCCRFARLLIPADLGDHWGRIVHHNHVCSAVPSSSVKVTDSSATRSCIKTEVYAHGKKKTTHTRARAQRNRSAAEKGATSRLQRVHFFPAIVERSQSRRKKLTRQSCTTFVKDKATLISIWCSASLAISRYKHGGFKASHFT